MIQVNENIMFKSMESCVENREKTNSSTGSTHTQQEPADKTTKGLFVFLFFALEFLFGILVLEERNKYAVEICKRIRDKLDGLDPDPLNQSSISEQVILRRSPFPYIDHSCYFRFIIPSMKQLIWTI